MSEDLKPCPFCGCATPYLAHQEYDAGDSTRVVCQDCGAMGADAITREASNAAWNRRTTDPRSDAAGKHEVHFVRDHALLDPEVYRRALDVALLNQGDDSGAVVPKLLCDTVDAIATERERRRR